MILATGYDIFLLSPALLMAVTGLVVLLLDFALADDQRGALSYVAQIGPFFALLGIMAVWQELPDKALEVFNGGARVDYLGLFLAFCIACATSVVLLMSQGPAQRGKFECGEYYALLLLAAGTMMIMVQSDHLITLFVAFETFSICLYALAGIARTRRSTEAALKYFVLGAFSSAILLFGIALMYGGSGTFQLIDIGPNFIGGRAILFWTGFGMVIIGIAFKIGAVPFHWWVPDVYDGTPTVVVGFMASAVKVAGFALAARLVLAVVNLGEDGSSWLPLLWVLSAGTMIAGNVLAVVQSRMRRLLAYSAIAHTGYILIALVALSAKGVEERVLIEALASLPFYLAVYTAMNLGAFAIASSLEIDEISKIRGLGFRRPWLALAMTIFMISLAGIPPTAGFIGKFVLFRGAIQTGFLGLALIGIGTSVIALYYYLRVVVLMYMAGKPNEETTFEPSFDPWGTHAAAIFSAGVVVLLAVAPASFHVSADWVWQRALDSARLLIAAL